MFKSMASNFASWLLITALLPFFLPIALAQERGVMGASYGDKPIGSYAPRLSKDLIIKGSRGEVVTLMLKISHDGCARMKATPFTRSDGRVAPVDIRFFRMERVETTAPSFPGAFVGSHFDPLIPLNDGRFCLNDGEAGWLWVDLKIAEQAAKGVYNSSFTFDQADPVRVSLTVWSMSMPQKPVLPAYSELTAWFNLLGHYGHWNDQEAVLSKAYVAAMLEHRIAPIKLHIRRPPVVEKQSGYFLNIDSYPDMQRSFKAVFLQRLPGWAQYDFPSVPFKDIRSRDTAKYFKAIENTIDVLGNDGRAFIYLWDEPGKENIDRVIEMAKFVRRLAPSLKIMVTIPYYSQLEDYVDIFVPVMDQFAVPGFASPEDYSALQKKGKQFWWYVSCMSHGCDALVDSGRPDFVIDRPASYIRSAAWLSVKYGVDAFLYYSVNNGYQFNPKRDPWASLWDFSGNGDGTLFYPGRAGERGFTTHQPVPSIRLKLWREASFDAEYLNWMERLSEKPDWWKKGFTNLVTSTQRWSRDYSAYSRLRERVGDFLDNQRSK